MKNLILLTLITFLTTAAFAEGSLSATVDGHKTRSKERAVIQLVREAIAQKYKNGPDIANDVSRLTYEITPVDNYSIVRNFVVGENYFCEIPDSWVTKNSICSISSPGYTLSTTGWDIVVMSDEQKCMDASVLARSSKLQCFQK